MQCWPAAKRALKPVRPAWIDSQSSFVLWLRVLLRSWELAFSLGPIAVAFVLHKYLGVCSRERWLRMTVDALARCGPVGIKWGQWASARYDLFEDDVCMAFGTLTNKVAAP